MSFIANNQTRRGTPRARCEVRAKVVHTATQKRRIELFITEPVLKLLAWQIGARVELRIGNGSDTGKLSLRPSHSGLALTASNKTTGTVRLCLYGDFIKPRACAGIQQLNWRGEGAELIVDIPSPWLMREAFGAK